MLSSYRVLDLTDERGSFCGALLGRLGADVIKIEKPGGSSSRNIGPFFKDIPDPQKSLSWFAFNTDKRGVTLDLEKIEGREIFKKLIRTADVVIESSDPGYMDRLGLSYSELEKLHPGIIMTSIAPFGQTGPYVDRGYKVSDLVLLALGGVLFTSGSQGKVPVHISHVATAFLLSSADAAWSTAIALYWRGLSGQGQHVDLSMQESVEMLAHDQHACWRVVGSPVIQIGNDYVSVNGNGSQWIWFLKDGFAGFTVTGGQWGETQIKPIVDWMDSEGMADEFIRNFDWANTVVENLPIERREQILDYFRKFLKTKTKDEVFKKAAERNLALEVVSSCGDIMKHPQLEAREYWQKVEHDDLGVTLTYPGPIFQASETVNKIRHRAPLVGEHNIEIYEKEMGFSKEELIALKEAEII